MKWLHMRYFWIATGIMAVLQLAKVLQGKEENLIGALIFTPLIGGLFWGVIATFVASKMKR